MSGVTEITDGIKSLKLDESKRQEIMANARASGADVSEVTAALNSLMNVSNGTALRAESLEGYRSQLSLVSQFAKGPVTQPSGSNTPGGGALAGARAGVAGGQSAGANSSPAFGGGIGIESFQSRIVAQDGFGYGGVLVRVVAGSPAQSSGLQNGDEVLFINGECVSDGAPGSRNRFASALASSPVGSEVVLKVRRAGGGIIDVRIMKTAGFTDATEAMPLGFPTVGTFAGAVNTKGGTDDGNNGTGNQLTGNQTSADGVSYDVSKISTRAIVGDIFAWHRSYSISPGLPGVDTLAEWVGGRRKAGKDLNFEFVQSINNVSTASNVLKFSADEGECVQVANPSKLFTDYAKYKDSNGVMQKYGPPFRLQPARTPSWGIAISPWSNVVVYGVGQTRTRADLDGSQGEKTVTDEKIRAEIDGFLKKKELGDFFPIYIIEPTGVLQMSVNSSVALGTKTLYISRKDLETYVAGLK